MLTSNLRLSDFLLDEIISINETWKKLNAINKMKLILILYFTK